MENTTHIENPVYKLLSSRKNSREKGVYSCCSANEYVIRAGMRRSKKNSTVFLVEATANQVNQKGGYTGMTPKDFYEFVNRLADEEGFPKDKLICGGDHLGPLTWTHLREDEAMKNALELVRAYVLAGFSKIHIDTSMRVASDDINEPLSDAVIAARGSQMCLEAEKAFAEYKKTHPNAPAPVYVIGSEVPIPGGAQENEDSVAVTKTEDFEATLKAFEDAFLSKGLESAWKRVVAVVVQPGVEFADESVIEYNRDAAKELTSDIKKYDNLVFEGHSTDYQTPKKLREMVEDDIAILKVGPALTFALREGLFALEKIEEELYDLNGGFIPSRLRWTFEQIMQEDKKHWDKYYHGDFRRRKYARAFSFSDRVRYYLTNDVANNAVKALLANLSSSDIPLALISQYLPKQYDRVRAGELKNSAVDLLIDHVGDCYDDYLYAVLEQN